MSASEEKKIVFVCTENVFRSLTAEFAARAAHQKQKGDLNLVFESAGISGRPGKPLRPDVKARAAHWNFDVSAHKSRRLTQDIVDSAALIIAMDKLHQKVIKGQFGYDAPLYLEIAEGRQESMLDLPDILPDFKNKPEASEVFIIGTIDRIVANQDRFMANLPKYLDKTP